MLINLSSISASKWGNVQIKKSIAEFESISDLNLSLIDPNLSETEIISLANPLIEKCVKLFSNADKNNAVCIDADSFFVFYFVKSMLERGFRCISPSFDEAKTDTNNSKVFIRYREFRLIF